MTKAQAIKRARHFGNECGYWDRHDESNQGAAAHAVWDAKESFFDSLPPSHEQDARTAYREAWAKQIEKGDL